MTKHTTFYEDCVREFTTAFDFTTYDRAESLPCEVAMLRSALIKEEWCEYLNAPLKSVDELDAICDLIYVTVGTNIVTGIPAVPYTSGQVPFNSWKIDINNKVLYVTSDLDSRFPCTTIQRKGLNELLQVLDDVATIHSYDIIGAFAEVHRSNMTKLWDENDLTLELQKANIVKPWKNKWLVKRADGKVIKPPTFEKPQLQQFL